MWYLRPKSRFGVLWRAFLAAVVVVGCGAATTAVAGLLQVHELVNDISVDPHSGVAVPGLTLPKAGKPETLLVIGSDHRVGSSTREANTDTMLLVRLDASSDTINVLSIPRDLEVTPPGYAEPQKINAAYSEGGYGLLLATLKSQVFPALQVTHIIDTNFTGFSDIIDAIGCVDSDVDHRYYNVSTGINGDPNDYSSIDIEPGYQRLCGDNQSVSGALPFVRFRHTDSDLVRNARQQDFLRWAKDGFSQSQLYHDRYKLLKILGRHSTYDKKLHSTPALLDLFELFVTADGSEVKSIPFPVGRYDNGGAIGDVIVGYRGPEQAAYQAFMTPTKSASAAKAKPTIGSSHRRRTGAGIDTAGLIADLPDGHTQAAALTHPRMPVYYPRLIVDGSGYCSSLTAICASGTEPASAYLHAYPRQYLVPTDGAGHKVAAYRMTLYIDAEEGRFYGIQGVAWRDPPLLHSPSGTEVVAGRKLFLYSEGGHLTQVAWHRGNDTYWVSNDLTSDIPNPELIGIAASMARWRG